MCMKVREIFLAVRRADLSAVTRGNPLHTSRENTAQGHARRCFPRMHNRHHNNKGLNFVFRIIFCEICCGCEKDRFSTVATALTDILSCGYFHSVRSPCGLYTLLKNEYSTLAV